jgi:hypothetical protein
VSAVRAGQPDRPRSSCTRAHLFPDLEYTFKHALTHEVAYGGVLQERRRALHAALVEAIGLLHADRLAEQVETLAHHAVRGSLTEKAVTYLRQAGTKAAQGIRPPRIFEVASYHALLACLAANVGYALRRARFSAPRVPVPR